jgi:hypothetical protein
VPEDQEDVEKILSEDGRLRATIVRRVDGLLSVEIERFFRASIVEDLYEEPAHWAPVHTDGGFVDTLERARKMARELLIHLG